MTSEKLNSSTVYDLSSYGVPQLTKFGLPATQRLAPQGNLSLLFPYTMLSIGTRFYVTHSNVKKSQLWKAPQMKRQDLVALSSKYLQSSRCIWSRKSKVCLQLYWRTPQEEQNHSNNSLKVKL